MTTVKASDAFLNAVRTYRTGWFGLAKAALLAMVLGTMGAQAQVTCNWAVATGGNFSTPGNWSVNVPTNGGSMDYVLVNTNSAGMSVTNDFPSSSFLLNGIVEASGSSHYIYGSNLEFRASNSGVLPFINFSSAANITLGIKANIMLTTNLLVSGWVYNQVSYVTFDGVISGVGDITNTRYAGSCYTVISVNNAGNTFSGNWVNVTNAPIAFASDGAIGAAANKIILDKGAIVGSTANIILGAGRQIIVGSGGGELNNRVNTCTWTLTNANMLAGGGLLRLYGQYNAGHSLTLNAQQPNFTGQVSVAINPCVLTLGGSNVLGNATGISAINFGSINLNDPYGAGSSTITNLLYGQIVLGTNLTASGGTRVYLNDMSLIKGTDTQLNSLTSPGNVTIPAGAYPMVIHTTPNGVGPSSIDKTNLVDGLTASTNMDMTIGDGASGQWRGVGVSAASYALGTSAKTLTLSGNAVLDAQSTWGTAGILTISNKITGGSAANTLGIRGNGTVVLVNTNNNFSSLIQGVGSPTLNAGHTASTMTFKFAPGSNTFGAVNNNSTGTLVLKFASGTSNTVSSINNNSTGTLVLDGAGSTNVPPGNTDWILKTGSTLVVSNGYYFLSWGANRISGQSYNLTVAGGTFAYSAPTGGDVRFANFGDGQQVNITGGSFIITYTRWGMRLGAGQANSAGNYNGNFYQSGGLMSQLSNGETGSALDIGGTTSSKTNAYYLSGGLLTIGGSTSGSMGIGSATDGSSLAMLSMTGGKLMTTERIYGYQGAGARQVFDFSGGTLAAATVDATKLSSMNAQTSQGTFVNNGGTLAPGDIDRSGRTTITGNYSNTASTAVMAIDIGGLTASSSYRDAANVGKFDFVPVSGNAYLGGNLLVNLIQGTTVGQIYKPASNNTFKILTSAALSGSFANVMDGKVWCADGYSRFDVLTNATANAVVLSNYVVNAWSQAAGGTWTNTANWSLATEPGSSDYAAYFGTSLSTSGTVTLDTAHTVRGLTFTNSTASYTIAGAALTLQGDTLTTPKISVLAGSHLISVSLALSNATEIAVATNSVLTLSGGITGGQDVTKTGTGLLVLGNVNTLGTLAISAGAVRFADGTTTVSAFTLASGTTCDFVTGTLYILKNGGGLDTLDEVTAALTANAFTVRGKTAVPADFSVTEEGSYIKVKAKVKGTIIRVM